MWIFLALLIVPLIEIGLFVEIGGAIGLWPTIAIVILTAILGAALLRAQGLATLGELQTRLQSGDDPSATLAHGALILIAGVVLLTPGFFTDAVGFLLLIPPVRATVIRFLASRIRVQSVHTSARWQARRPGGADGPTVVDGVYEEVEPTDAPRPGGKSRPAGSGRPSGWTLPEDN